MSFLALLCVWLAFVGPLVIAAVGRHRTGTKVAALITLAAVLTANWLFVGLAFADPSTPEDPAWLSPLTIAAGLLCFYLLVIVAACRRRLS